MAVDVVEIAGHQMVVMPLADYQRLARLANGISEVIEHVGGKGALTRGREISRSEALSRIQNGENRLKVWRSYRGLTQHQLGLAVGLTKVTISKYEAGKLVGSHKVWRQLASALSIEVDDILPEN